VSFLILQVFFKAFIFETLYLLALCELLCKLIVEKCFFCCSMSTSGIAYSSSILFSRFLCRQVIILILLYFSKCLLCACFQLWFFMLIFIFFNFFLERGFLLYFLWGCCLSDLAFRISFLFCFSVPYKLALIFFIYFCCCFVLSLCLLFNVP
jgi:hypothetical protein